MVTEDKKVNALFEKVLSTPISAQELKDAIEKADKKESDLFKKIQADNVADQ